MVQESAQGGAEALMAYLMLPALALFLSGRRWAKTVLLGIALAAVTGLILEIMGALPGAELSLTDAAFYIGLIAVGLSPIAEYAAAYPYVKGEQVSGSSCIDTDIRDAGEDDIVNNKQKWRLIIAGYVIFILFAIVMVASVVKLNAKINTLYGFSQDLDKRIESLE